MYLATIGAFTSAYAQADLFGKLIFIGLMLLSVICWVVLVYKIWMFRKVKAISEIFKMAFEKNKEQLLSLEVGDLPKPRLKEIPHPFGDIFANLKQKTVEILNKNHFFSKQTNEDLRTPSPIYLSRTDLEVVESHVLTIISTQTKHLEKNLFILSTITTLAPFLGLLGTVWGILVTFAELHGGGSIGSNSAILGGLSTALATTVLGLVIAIPALVAYNYLKNTLKTLASDMEDFLYLLLSHVELQYRKADIDEN